MRAGSERGPRLVALACLALAAAASLATSAPRGYRRYPSWRTVRTTHVVDGAVVAVWVSRSGREGLGVSVEIDPRQTGLSFAVARDGTSLRIGRRTLQPASIQRAPAPGDRTRLYLPFPFDGLAAWNEGRREAMLHVVVVSAAGRRTIVTRIHHSLESYHLSRQPTAPRGSALTRSGDRTGRREASKGSQ